MQNQYELMAIFTPILSDDEFKNVLKEYVKYIEDNGGEMVSQETWGLKQLAYEIDQKTTGIYQIFQFKAPGSLIAELELLMKRDDNVMRFLTTRLDKYAVEWNETRKERRANKKKEEAKEPAKESAKEEA